MSEPELDCQKAERNQQKTNSVTHDHGLVGVLQLAHLATRSEVVGVSNVG